MKKIFFIIMVLVTTISTKAQKDTVTLKPVTVKSTKIPVSYIKNPGSVSIVDTTVLKTQPKTIGADEALRLIPGIKVDNQHDGERVHISIRGQGILTERGIRGIGVLLDGFPLNDPSGFVPDLYDIDWAFVRNIEVLRGPVAGIYGTSGAGGLISVTSDNGKSCKPGGKFMQTVGSGNFTKTFLQAGGATEKLNYVINTSYLKGDGYRIHQGFKGDNIYEKLIFTPSQNIKITQIAGHTDYFHQNPEGLNIAQFKEDPKLANPDAIPFNEYQKTVRNRMGIKTELNLKKAQKIMLMTYLNDWRYKETSNKCAEYRDVSNPGFNFQYSFAMNTGKIKHNIVIGEELKWQNIYMHKLQSAPDTTRTDALNEDNIETDSLLANQTISQSSNGLFIEYQLGIGNLTFTAGARKDILSNTLNNKMLGGDTAITTKNFDNVSYRAGLSYAILPSVALFANVSTGFIPPSTEELASNPLGYSGFNTHLVPATATEYEGGIRGMINNKLNVEVTLFRMITENDFFRFKQRNRGNQEVFYGNAGNSDRKGIEIYANWKPVKNFGIALAYTYSDFKYTSATIDPVYTDTTYVLTSPPVAGQYLPNSPKHKLYAEVSYRKKGFELTLSDEYQSEWAIYTDPDAYFGISDPATYVNWTDPFNLVNARLAYNFKLFNTGITTSLFIRNITDEKYAAFTEPDPDGNSYHPGPGREIFFTLKVNF